MRRRISGSAADISRTRSNFSSFRSCCHRWWYRYWRRPAASVPTAWICPFGYGQIHTFFQAGGITRSLMRCRVAASVTGTPS
jgi:hypothetical protein